MDIREQHVKKAHYMTQYANMATAIHKAVTFQVGKVIKNKGESRDILLTHKQSISEGKHV